MTHDIINCGILSALFLVLFGLTELLHHKIGVQSDHTRKVVHIGTGLLTMLFPVMLQSHWFVLLLCSGFALILFLSLKFNFLRSINDIDRVSHGSLLYPLAVYIAFVFYTNSQCNYLYFYLPVLNMAICDPVAAIFGRKWPRGKFYIMGDGKSATGCIAFFLSSIIVIFVLMHFLSANSYSLLTVISIAILATLSEAVSTKGFDNLTIPLSVILVLTLLHV